MIIKKTFVTLFIGGILFQTLQAQTTFNWDTNVTNDNPEVVSETIDGITVTFTSGPNISSTEENTIIEFGGMFGNIVTTATQPPISATECSFSFSEPVEVNSIVALEGIGQDIDYTFTPIGGNNSPITVSLFQGGAIANLNWTDVTSFTVTSTQAWYGFDNLLINNTPLSIKNYDEDNITIYPNPVKDILTLKNINQLKFINIYNTLGQLVIKSDTNKIDFGPLDAGIYLVHIHTETGVKIKKIVKN